ncbi:MAG TPA: CoA ester lyase [Methylomirabilota bacterium]|nr:CoA ester lyase [Methylomirabilota bacterium]
MRLRRSLLFVPATAPERIAKAAASPADAVVLDLEDAVVSAQKAKAREWVVAALRRVDFGGRERVVRVNPLDTAFGADDLAAVVPLAPDALLLPKVRTLGDLVRVDRAVGRLEQDASLPLGGIRFHLLVETVAGVLGVETLAAGSTRNAALLFGAGDLGLETRARPVAGRLGELHALSQMLLAARAAGLDAVDAPYLTLRDPEGLETHARFAVDLGFDGKAVIHPAQLEVVNRLFAPSREDVVEAERVLAAYQAAEGGGKGVFALDGRMIDAVHMMVARQTLARARQAGSA